MEDWYNILPQADILAFAERIAEHTEYSLTVCTAKRQRLCFCANFVEASQLGEQELQVDAKGRHHMQTSSYSPALPNYHLFQLLGNRLGAIV